VNELDKIHQTNVRILVALIVIFISAALVLEAYTSDSDRYRRKTRRREVYCKYVDFYNELLVDYPLLWVNVDKCEEGK
jgi:hypothetical protein